MIRKSYHTFSLLLALFMVVSMSAQTKSSFKVNGKIMDGNNNPLSGAKITASEGKMEYSDVNGTFSLSVKGKGKILVELAHYASQIVEVHNADSEIVVQLQKSPLFMGEQDMVNIPFAKMEKGRIVGSVSSIDVPDNLDMDQRIGIGSAISGKVSGVFNNSNVLGLGNATYIVDGMPRSADYVNLTEVESITILKDPVSRVLYGSMADKGIIMITTKRGKPFKKGISVRADYGLLSPMATPDYLGAADYMQIFNQALSNDGRGPRYSPGQIAGARAGTDPVAYPDVNFYDNMFVKDHVTYFNANVEANGGNESAQYYLNLGLSNNEGWLNLGEKEATNRMNVRTNTDFKLTSGLKMNLDAVAVFDFYRSPDVFEVNNNGKTTSDFWTTAQSSLPNSYPLLIPISRISDLASYQGANLINGNSLLGGSNDFRRNIYGDMTGRGVKKINDRYLQVNTGLEWDLGFITKGLSLKGNISFDFFNRTVESQNKSYAVYQPQFLTDMNGVDSLSVVKVGVDVPSNERTVNANEGDFSRRLGVYATLNYKKNFGDNSLTMNALAYRDELALPNNLQKQKSLNFGLRANYMFKQRYLVEFDGAFLGSQRLPKGDQYAFSPTLGLGWVASNEDFFNKHGKVDYLKLRGTVGLLQNDNWGDYFLYQTSFSTGSWFNYGNTTGGKGIRNQIINYDNLASPIGWQKRLEFNLGFDVMFFDRSLYFEGSAFYSKSYNLITVLRNATPDLLGYNITSNNDAYADSGLEYHLTWTKFLGKDFKMSLTASTIYATSKVKQLDEPVYPSNSQYRVRTGSSSDAIYGLTAIGLYGESDFNADGSLVSGLPYPTFGAVQPGDIKYMDINGDGSIDDNDQSIIGNRRPNLQYSLDVHLQYKNFEFYVLGLGQSGNDNMRDNDYFWTYGDLKYSVTALDAYGPNNKDVNASMPRLSSTRNSNNYRNSSYWLYSNSFFTIPTMQLSYNLKQKATGTIKSMKFFVKGSNLLTINKNQDISNLRFGVGSSPLTRGFSLGVVTSF